MVKEAYPLPNYGNDLFFFPIYGKEYEFPMCTMHEQRNLDDDNEKVCLKVF